MSVFWNWRMCILGRLIFGDHRAAINSITFNIRKSGIHPLRRRRQTAVIILCIHLPCNGQKFYVRQTSETITHSSTMFEYRIQDCNEQQQRNEAAGASNGAPDAGCTARVFRFGFICRSFWLHFLPFSFLSISRNDRRRPTSLPFPVAQGDGFPPSTPLEWSHAGMTFRCLH